MTRPFSNLDEFRALLRQAPKPCERSLREAAERNGQLTKPPGALGRLEDLALWYAGWQRTPEPRIKMPQIVVFAANHGVAARGVSAFPPAVTEQMVLNFQRGGAAINQLAEAFGAKMDVHAIELDRPTADFTEEPAMSETEVIEALALGWSAVDPQADVLVAGEMGIGNTTSAAALAAACIGGSAEAWTGRGTGVDDAGLALKRQVVAEGLERHAGQGDGLEMLRRLGGRELAAMAGAIAGARHLRIPVILDGFICSAAASSLAVTEPSALAHCVAGHLSAEGAHRQLLDALKLEPLLDLGLRLGEGSGAAVALGVLQAAVACHSGMATFAEAGVASGAPQ